MSRANATRNVSTTEYKYLKNLITLGIEPETGYLVVAEPYPEWEVPGFESRWLQNVLVVFSVADTFLFIWKSIWLILCNFTKFFGAECESIRKL